MGEINLVRPALSYAEDIMEIRQEFLDFDPKGEISGSGSLKECKSAEEWIKSVENMRNRDTCPADLVDSDIYLAVREPDRKIVGIAEFRHHISHPVLGLWGGHIGYCVRPLERRKGYAKEILRQILDCCRDYGMEKVMVTCREDNTASERTILANGGKYEKTVYSSPLNSNMKRFWISL